MQSLIGNTNLNLDIPADIINNFNQTYSQISELKFKNDEKKRQQIEDDLLEQAKYYIQVGRDLIKQGVPSDKVQWAFKSPRTVMQELKNNYDSYKKIIDEENKNIAWQNFINKYAGAGEFNRQEWEQDPISVEKRLLENKVKKGEVNWSNVGTDIFGENQKEIKPETKVENKPITTTQKNIQPLTTTQQKTNQIPITSQNQSPAVQTNVPTTTSYTIQKGDILTKIAQKNNITLPELLKLNPDIKNPNFITVGKKINLPQQTNIMQQQLQQPNTSNNINAPAVTSPQPTKNIYSDSAAGLNIENNNFSNSIDIKINNIKKEKERILQKLQTLNEDEKKGKTGEVLFNRLLYLESKIDKLDIDAINFEQSKKLMELKKNMDYNIYKIKEDYNFKRLEEKLLNQQKIKEIKENNTKIDYQAQIDVLNQELRNAKTSKEKQKIRDKMIEIQTAAAGKNTNINIPYLQYESIDSKEIDDNNVELYIDNDKTNITVPKDGKKVKVSDYGIEVWWDKNANNGKGILKTRNINQNFNKNIGNKKVFSGTIGNIKYTIEKQ